MGTSYGVHNPVDPRVTSGLDRGGILLGNLGVEDVIPDPIPRDLVTSDVVDLEVVRVVLDSVNLLMQT